ncbi:MAG: threonine/serine exporter family protein [Polyangiaceae bacterium]|jgi:uncharacterized membrane protein YjjB (DUF3815 family)
MTSAHLASLAAYHFVLGCVATCGFALWFNVPRGVVGRTCLFGGGAYVVRLLLLHMGESPAAAAFWAALFVGLAGYAQARKARVPRVILTVPAVIPLVPGIPAYDTIVNFFRGDALGGLGSAVKATMILVALAGGLTAARVVTWTSRPPP